MTIDKKSKMTASVKSRDGYEAWHTDNCIVKIDADNIRVEVPYNRDVGYGDEVWEGKQDPQGIFRLERVEYDKTEETWATLCWIDGRLIGDWQDMGKSGLWRLEFGE